MKRIVLIDADILLFRVTQQNDVSVKWDEEFCTRTSDLEHCCHVFDESVQGIVKKVKADDYILCISGDKNFRKHKVTDSYKANRAGVEKPMNYQELKQHALTNHPSKMYEELEADDVMGIMMTMKHPDKEYVIHSDDKDMWTIPGLLWDRFTHKIVEVSELEADRFLYGQILTGDRTDGYIGCPGIGKVKAKKILQDAVSAEQMRDAVLDAFIKVYKDEGIARDNMVMQAQLARILRAEDFDFQNKSIKLWSPWREK